MRTRPYIPLRERQKRRERRRRALRRSLLSAALIITLIPLIANRINASPGTTPLIEQGIAALAIPNAELSAEVEASALSVIETASLSAKEPPVEAAVTEEQSVTDERQALSAMRVLSDAELQEVTQKETSLAGSAVAAEEASALALVQQAENVAEVEATAPLVETALVSAKDAEDIVERGADIEVETRPAALTVPAAVTSAATEPTTRALLSVEDAFCSTPDCRAAGAPFSATGLPRLLAQELGKFGSFVRSEDERFYETDVNGERIRFTLDPQLQEYAEGLMEQYRIPWGAIVAVEPATGKILTLASYSSHDQSNPRIALQGGFPAASLFKVVTAAAGVERSGLSANSKIRFRGGNYTLTRYNYYPDPKTDRRAMSLATALGKSCNPAFARVALNHLSADILQYYAENFGFNQPIPFELPLELSEFTLPETDYEIARTAAGFMNAQITPVHAALLAAAVGNGGVMMRPYMVEWIRDSAGTLKYQSSKLSFRRAVLPSTAVELLRMMDNTTVEGTARRHFQRAGSKLLREMQVAGKTGTLSGPSPKGVYHWFVGVAPSDLDSVGAITADMNGTVIGAESAEIAVAALVIDPGGARINGTGLARRFLEFYFQNSAPQMEARAHDRENG